MADIEVKLTLEGEEFHTLLFELDETETRLRSELNELSRAVDDSDPHDLRSPEDQEVWLDVQRRLSDGRERLRRIQALIEDFGGGPVKDE